MHSPAADPAFEIYEDDDADAEGALGCGEVLYQSSMTPDPRSARDVLAFVLCPTEAFAPAGDEDELAAVEQLIQPAKIEAVRRWYSGHTATTRN
jgi:hypothetical protein